MNNLIETQNTQKQPVTRLRQFHQETFNNSIQPTTKQESQQTIHATTLQTQNPSSTPNKLFTKTKNILEHLTSYSIFNKDTLKKGMKISFAQFDDTVFFKLTVDAETYLACAYAYILDERTFLKEESPKIHITQCDDIKAMPKDYVKICTPTTNAFDYRVRSNGIDTRLFYEHPLRICQVCMMKLAKVLSIKHKKEITLNQLKEQEIINLLCKNKLKNLVL